jgi:hypothetical protein
MALSRSVYANFAAFPGSGVADVIYVDASNDNQFLWNGTNYVSYAPEPIGVLLGNKPDAWFSANPTFVLGKGQVLLLTDGIGLYVDAYKLGDGKTELQNLVWKGLKEDLNIHSAGLIDGGQITINGLDNTKIDIAPLTGVIVDYWTNPSSTSVNYIDYPGATAVSVTNLATSTLSYICIDKDGTIIQYATAPTDAQRRDVIVLAQLGHAANTIIASVNPYVSVFASPVEQLRDLFYELKLINEGNLIVANGANLQINKSNGFLFGFGINYYNDIKQPNKRNIPAQTAASFRYRTQTGGITTPVNLIDPTQYDNAGTITAISGGGNQATNQRVFLFPNGNLVIQYGQTIYNTLQLAIQGVQSENFNQFINVSEAAILIGIISVTKGCTALNNATNARFIPVTKFGENIGGAAGISVSNLQNAYDNSNEPEIVTDATRGAVTFKRGSDLDTDDVHEIQNGAGVKRFSVNGNGRIFSEDLTALRIVETDASKNLISVAKNSGYNLALGTTAGTVLEGNRITQTITNGVTTSAPSEDAVFDALADKKDTQSQIFISNVLSPADSTTYYFSQSLTPTTTAANHAFRLPYNGIVRGASIVSRSNSVSGSTENNTINFRNITTTTSTLISNTVKTNSSATQMITNIATGLNISFLSTDEFCLEWITPAYATNPTNIGFTIFLDIEKTS